MTKCACSPVRKHKRFRAFIDFVCFAWIGVFLGIHLADPSASWLLIGAYTFIVIVLCAFHISNTLRNEDIISAQQNLLDDYLAIGEIVIEKNAQKIKANNERTKKLKQQEADLEGKKIMRIRSFTMGANGSNVGMEVRQFFEVKDTLKTDDEGNIIEVE